MENREFPEDSLRGAAALSQLRQGTPVRLPGAHWNSFVKACRHACQGTPARLTGHAGTA